MQDIYQSDIGCTLPDIDEIHTFVEIYQVLVHSIKKLHVRVIFVWESTYS